MYENTALSNLCEYTAILIIYFIFFDRKTYLVFYKK